MSPSRSSERRSRKTTPSAIVLSATTSLHLRALWNDRQLCQMIPSTQDDRIRISSTGSYPLLTKYHEHRSYCCVTGMVLADSADFLSHLRHDFPFLSVSEKNTYKNSLGSWACMNCSAHFIGSRILFIDGNARSGSILLPGQHLAR